jgi:hypothetical protein
VTAFALQTLELPTRQRVVAIALAATILVLVIELVRRRKLREEYSWVWVSTSLVLIALAAQTGLLLSLTEWIGAASSTSTLFFFGVVFLMLLALQFSVRLSRLTQRHKILGQRLGLLEAELERLRARQSDVALPEGTRNGDSARNNEGAHNGPDGRNGDAARNAGAPVLPLRAPPELRAPTERVERKDQA